MKRNKCHVAVYERLLATQTEDTTKEFYRTEPERVELHVVTRGYFRKSNCFTITN